MPNRIKVISALLILYIVGALLPIAGERSKPVRRAAAAEAHTPELPPPVAPSPRRPRAQAPVALPSVPEIEGVSYGSSDLGAAMHEPSARPESVEIDLEPPRPDNFVALQQQWERESDDLRSTEAQRAELTTLFEELQLPPELIRDVRCRRSVCRIAVDASNPLQLASLASRVQESDVQVSFRMQDGQAFAYVPRG